MEIRGRKEKRNPRVFKVSVMLYVCLVGLCCVVLKLVVREKGVGEP